MSAAEIKYGAALALAGIHAGAMSFGSFVEVPTLNAVVNASNAGLLRAYFPIWWPYGRNFMAPLVLASSAAAAVAYTEVLFGFESQFAYGCVRTCMDMCE